MVELTEIPSMKKENVFHHMNHLADIAKTDNFMQKQIDIAHYCTQKNRCSNYNSVNVKQICVLFMCIF